MDSTSPKIFMRDRKEVAELIYKDYKEMQRATFDVAAQWGRWLLASLLLIHGGALFGLFTFLSELADNPSALSQYQATVWWFVAGIMLTLFAGMLTWMNWSMHSDDYDNLANAAMLWDPEEWIGKPAHTWGLNITYYAAIALGLLSAACIAGGAYSTLNGKWIPEIVTAVV